MVTSPRELQIIWWGGGVVCEAFFSPYIFQQYRSAARASLKREREKADLTVAYRFISYIIQTVLKILSGSLL